CLDLDTFFVSVERLLDPSLEGRPVVVGGEKGGPGVVVSASYEVRAFGVRSGMSIFEASRLAPQAIFVSGHHGLYGEYSAAARAIVERYSPIVIAASIDEQYVDFHGCEGLYRRPEDADDDATILRTVREITDAIQRELRLPASAGIAATKPMAKVASALAKPRGVMLVPAGAERSTLAPLPVRKLPGVGPVSEAKLHAIGVTTLGELAAAPDARLQPIFGATTRSIRDAAAGGGTRDLGRERPAFQEHDPRGERVGSISNEQTFVERSRRDAEAVLAGLSERVAYRARRRGVKAGRVTLRLRYADFHTITRSRTLASPTSADVELHAVALGLYREARTRPLAVRLLGVALSRLDFWDGQLALWDSADRRGIAIDRCREKFGYDAVHLGTVLARPTRR
ncbi:MAG TPA: DNA polymerase IV, partial [Minicystis sp.]|nr:DNA polymerase IV [Minicystis sp.]